MVATWQTAIASTKWPKQKYDTPVPWAPWIHYTYHYLWTHKKVWLAEVAIFLEKCPRGYLDRRREPYRVIKVTSKKLLIKGPHTQCFVIHQQVYPSLRIVSHDHNSKQQHLLGTYSQSQKLLFSAVTKLHVLYHNILFQLRILSKIVLKFFVSIFLKVKITEQGPISILDCHISILNIGHICMNRHRIKQSNLTCPIAQCRAHMH